MTCEAYGNVVICRPGAMERIVDKTDGERWCFKCREVREFRYTVDREIQPSYYGPNPAIRCGVCQVTDADLGFGRVREWDG